MHFLRKDELEWPRPLGRNRAVVRVRVDGTHLLLSREADSIGVARHDVPFVPLPERFEVVGPDRKLVKPSKGKRFWVSVETFDPFHLVTEAENLPLR